MLVDLNKGLTTADVDSLEWVDVESVIHTATNAAELAKQLINMHLESPSSAYDSEGDYLWDYKDGNMFTFNILSQVTSAVEGVEITGQSEGPRYWFVSFTYKGEEAGFGPGYKGE